ncbi:hypothetical protein HDU97_008467 [Phlyctochytrium planicorne]|nr:hypothetical protein HDU97_008467 [Phlyctochytrium planicorne]
MKKAGAAEGSLQLIVPFKYKKIPPRRRHTDPAHHRKKRKHECNDVSGTSTVRSDHGPPHQPPRLSPRPIMAEQRMRRSLVLHQMTTSSPSHRVRSRRLIYDKELDPPIFESFKMVSNEIVIEEFCKLTRPDRTNLEEEEEVEEDEEEEVEEDETRRKKWH